jgi:signal-transduction protein with cAMP-binding, CBS, and nucleotidyltransferase domain
MDDPLGWRRTRHPGDDAVLVTEGMLAADGSTDDVEAFLRDRPPFQGLDADALRRIAVAATPQAFPREATIIEQGGDPAASLFVIRSGSVEIRNEGRVVDVPGEGEVFGELSLLTGLEPTASVVAHEDTVCYLIDAALARDLLGTPGGTAFVQASLKRVTANASEHVSSTAVRSGIRAAADGDAAIAAARALPTAVAALVDAGADAIEIGRVVGSTVDALTRRLTEFAVTDLGEAPAPWAWLAMGSQARLEQALHTDQDHALAYDAQGRTRDELDPYFAELAERVTAGLEAAGIPRCAGDAMAVTPGLRRSIEEWREAYGRWMADPGAQGSIFTSITFDFRAIAGPLAVEPELEAIVATARDNQPFLRHLTRRALDESPPTGFFKGRLVLDRGEHVGRLDIKHGGITIIGNIARTFSIRDGRTEKRTLDRLRAAEESRRIDRDRREALEEAFRLLWQTRLEHQAAQVRAGQEPDEFVDPERLGPITRLGLKEAFRIVASEQKRLAGELAHY